MKKRVLAALLWFYAAWYAWSVFAWMVGLPELLGPVAGAAVAAFIAGDPLGRIWQRREVARAAMATPPPVAAELA